MTRTFRHHNDFIHGLTINLRLLKNSEAPFHHRLYDFYMDVYEDISGVVQAHYSYPPRDDFSKFVHYLYLKFTGRGHFNEVTFLSGGRLMLDNLSPELYLHERTESIMGLYNYLDSKGTPFLYVRIPNKLQDNSMLPKAFSENNIIQNGDDLLNNIADNGTNTLDLRAKMVNDDLNFKTAFFRYHLHWTNETVLWASRTLGEYINNKYGFNIDLSLWNIENYDKAAFRWALHGTEANSIGGYFVSENITFLIPRFPVDLEMSNNIQGLDASASNNFTQIFLPSVYAGNTNFEEYEIRLPGSHFTRIVNNNIDEDKRILLISDSYSLSWSMYLSLGIKNLDFIYLITNQTHNFLWNYLEATDYDLVIFALSDVTVSIDSAPEFELDRLYLGVPPNR